MKVAEADSLCDSKKLVKRIVELSWCGCHHRCCYRYQSLTQRLPPEDNILFCSLCTPSILSHQHRHLQAPHAHEPPPLAGRTFIHSHDDALPIFSLRKTEFVGEIRIQQPLWQRSHRHGLVQMNI